MPSSSRIADSFAEEMEKIALGNIAGSAATLGAIGSLAGGGYGYLKAKSQGQDTGDALRSAGRGALIGGGGGAALGAGLGQGAKLLREKTKVPGWLEGASHLDEGISNFGRRQVHAVSDYVPKGEDRTAYLKRIGIGGKPEEALQAAQAHLKDVEGGGGKGWIPLPQSVRKGLAKWDVFNAEHALKSNEELIRAGATSIPGMARAAFDPTKRGDLMRGVGRDLAFGGGTLGTAMLLQSGHDLYKGVRGDVQPGQEGMGYGQRLGESVGNAAGWLLPTPIPMAGQMLGGTVLSKTLGGVGAGADRLRGAPASYPRVRPPAVDPTDPVASTGHQLGGPEVVMSSSAAGKPYGGGIE